MNGSRSTSFLLYRLWMFIDYLGYWSLRRRPFLTSHDDFYFAGTIQRRAFARLHQWIGGGEPFATLVSPRGCGATRWLAQVAKMRGMGDCAVETVQSRGAEIGRREPEQALASALALSDPRQLSSVLRRNRQHGIRTVWMIDRCQVGSLDRVQQWARQQPSLSVLAVLEGDRATVRQMAGWLQVCRIDLTPLDRDEVADYLAYGMRQAAASVNPFTEVAVDRLHQQTAGVIAELAYAAETALATAAHLGRKQVTPEMADMGHRQAA